MAYIDESKINDIRNQANIVDIISSYIPLEKSGKDYVGVCPFHDDHSPSMRVSTKLNIFKCFVCNTGGNVFSFVQKYENVSYIEAVRIVASKTGIDFKYDTSSVPIKHKEEFDLMDLSLKYYQNTLASQKGIDAKKYLNNRGITDQIIKDFKFGLSLGNNELRDFFKNKKCNLELGYNLGLLNKTGVDYYDMFSDRIMIPIFDMQGHLAGYTARAYLKDEKSKYINSKETEIYHKSNILFNYYMAKDTARLNHELVIVEGNMDAISMYANGIKNVCALMGVVISESQIEAIKKLNSRIVLMLDSDNAGSLATVKVGDSLYASGVDTYVVRLAGAKDPDEYIHKFGVSVLEDAIKHAKKYLDFKIDYLKENRNLDNNQELTEYIKDVISSLDKASELERHVTISRICNEYGLDPGIIGKELRPIEKKDTPVVEVRKPKVKQTRYDLAVQELIYAMLLNKDYYRIYLNDLGYLINKKERDLVSMIGSYIKKHNNIDMAGLMDMVINYDEISEYLNMIVMNNKKEIVEESEFYDILSTVSKCTNEEEIKQLKERIKNAKDINEKLKLMEKLTELKKGCGNNERD